MTRVYFETYQQTTLMLHGLACACAVANKQNKRNFKQMQTCQLHILHTRTTQTETEKSVWLTGSLGFTSPLQQWQKKRCGGTAAASAIFHESSSNTDVGPPQTEDSCPPPAQHAPRHRGTAGQIPAPKCGSVPVLSTESRMCLLASVSAC